MHWVDRALVLGARPHGEAGVVLELMTFAHGRHLGLLHGGRSRRIAPVIQPGNLVQASWRARIDEQLGSFTVEPLRTRTDALIGSGLALLGLAVLAGHLRLLPERDPHPTLFEAASVLVGHLDDPALAAALLVRFELVLLAELGFGLDLSSCAATGASHDLAYVSPRSARAVGREPGAAYRDRLLALPAFLQGEVDGAPPRRAELSSAFRLTGFFLDEHVYGPRGGAGRAERDRFVTRALAAAEGEAVRL